MRLSSGLFIAAVLAAAPAFAADDTNAVKQKAQDAGQAVDDSVDVAPEAKEDYAAMSHGDISYKPMRYDVAGGLGFGGFAQGVGDATGTGFAWTGRIGADWNSIIGAELGYQGFSSDVNALIIQQGGQNGAVLNDQSLGSNLFSLSARAGVPLDVQGHELKPYAVAGVGYNRISANSTLESFGINSDNNFAIPLGIGVGYALNRTFLVDARFSYNILTGVSEPLLGDTADSWTGLINLGARFGQ